MCRRVPAALRSAGRAARNSAAFSRAKVLNRVPSAVPETMCQHTCTSKMYVHFGRSEECKKTLRDALRSVSVTLLSRRPPFAVTCTRLPARLLPPLHSRLEALGARLHLSAQAAQARRVAVALRPECRPRASRLLGTRARWLIQLSEKVP